MKYYNRGKDVLRHSNNGWELYTKNGWVPLGTNWKISESELVSIHKFIRLENNHTAEKIAKIVSQIF